MIDWNTQTQWRCTACNFDYDNPASAVKCHDASLLTVVECSLCGKSHEADFARNATAAAAKCCREENNES